MSDHAENQGESMEVLNYKILAETKYDGYVLKDAPVKVLQFGDGNFLRAFADYWFDLCNEKADWNGKIAIAQATSHGHTDLINQQEGLYTVYLRGLENGKVVNLKRVITDVKDGINPYSEDGFAALLKLSCSDELEYIVSNTTEAGIAYDPNTTLNQVPPASFPGKLTRILYERFKAGKGGLIILSCELIDNNGQELKKIIHRHIDDWHLGDDFWKWVNEENLFCSTLVDRIVPGRIRDPQEVKQINESNGYIDHLIDVGEVFGVWYIEGPKWLEEKLPFNKAGVNVHVVPDVAPYKKRKVRILNGAHTGVVLGAYLSGFDIVRECMHDKTILDYMNKMLKDEVIPILPLDKEDCLAFASAVEDRFNNPFIDHQILSISLNSTAKWRARNLPSLLEYMDKFGKIPTALAMSFAAYIAFYSNDIQRREPDALVCKRPKGDEYKVQDDSKVLDFYFEHRKDDIRTLVHEVMRREDFWGQDLSKIDGFEQIVADDLALIRTKGVKDAYSSAL
jgi:tagaturonate reductase